MTEQTQELQAIAEGLKSRTVVPYIGPGVFELMTEPCPIPKGSPELVAALTAKSAVPGRIRTNLTASAQYIESRKHRKTLDSLLNGLFKHALPASPVHRWLAALPTPPALIVDVWYDDALEKALAERGNWGQIQGQSHPQSEGLWVKFYGANGKETTPEAAAGWETVLYKPSGGVSPAGNFLISDSDFVEVLTEIDIQTPIPPIVQERRTGKNFLYLGCRFNAEIQRTFARQIAKRSTDRHWAVIAEEMTKNEAGFCEKLGITVLNMPLAEAMERLKATHQP
ncbi:MAG TPA: SIR2 family protein [Azospirillaceae bacterium]|nr:SIR2 family protein [Azospirillaceae bacterium]